MLKAVNESNNREHSMVSGNILKFFQGQIELNSSFHKILFVFLDGQFSDVKKPLPTSGESGGPDPLGNLDNTYSVVCPPRRDRLMTEYILVRY